MQFMKRRLLSGGAWAFGGRVMLAFIGLATNMLLARLLSPAELGAYFLAYSVVVVFAGLGSMGLMRAVVRFVAQSMGLRQYEKARRAIRLSLFLGSSGAVTVGVVYLHSGGAFVGHFFDSPALAAVVGVTTGWIIVVAIQGVIVETFRGFHDIRMTTALGGIANGNGIVSGGLLSLLLLLLWIFEGRTNLTTVMFLAASSGAVSVVVAGWLLRRKVASLPRGEPDVRLGVGEMMQVAWPLMVTTLALFILGQSSIWIVGAFLSQDEVALYGAAYRLMLYVAIPIQIANMVAPPLIAEMYVQGRRRELERTLRSIATIAGIPAFVLLSTFVLFGGSIMGLVFGDYYREAAVLLAMLSLGQMVSVWAGSCGETLMMTGHQTTMMAVSIAIGLLMVAGAIWAVQHYGVTGVAVASASGIVLQNIVMLLLVKNRTGVWTHAGLSGLFSAERAGR